MARLLTPMLAAALSITLLSSFPPDPRAGGSPGARLAARFREVDSLLSLERSAAADSLATLALAEAEQADPPDSAMIAGAMMRVGKARYARRMLKDSVAYTMLTGSLAIQSRLSHPDYAELAETHTRLGRVLAETDRADSALIQYAAALAAAEAGGLANDSTRAVLLWNKGTALRTLSRPREAEATLLDAIARMERWGGPQHTGLPLLLNVLSGAYVDLGRFAEARAALERAIGIVERTQGGESADLIPLVNRQATIEHRAGDTARSIELLERALAISAKVYGAEDVHSFPLRYNTALRLMDFGDYKGASRWFRDALRIGEAHYGKGHISTEQTRTMLGYAEVSAGDTAEALRDLDQAQAELEKRPLDPNQMLVYCYRSRAAVLLMRGDVQGARRVANRGLAILATSPSPLLEAQMGLYEQKVEAARLASDLSGLDSTNAQMAALFDTPESRGLETYMEYLCLRGRSEAALGRVDSAWVHLLAAEQIERQRLERNIRALPDARALEFSSLNAAPLDFLIQFASGRGPSADAVAWDRVIRWRGSVHDEMARRRAPEVAAGDTALAGAHGRWTTSAQRLARAEVGGAPPASLETLRTESAEAERSYGSLIASHGIGPDTAAASLERVRGALAPREALVGIVESFASGDTARLIAFVVPSAAAPVQRIELGPTRRIRDAIGAWRAAISTPPEPGAEAESEAACRKLGSIVRSLTWGRLAPAIGGAGAVALVPDGPLVDLPWAALPEGKRGYWVEHAPRLRTIESERTLLEPDSRVGRGMLALGDPDFNRRGGAQTPAPTMYAAAFRGPLGNCASGEALKFPPLAGARAEAMEVADRWDAAHPLERARRLLGADADQPAFCRDAPGREVLHIATHGVVWGDSCAPVAANGRGVGGVGRIGPGRAARKPGAGKPAGLAAAAAPTPSASPIVSPWMGRRVWLALAGANHARETALESDDGLLTATDISLLDLSGVRWVVLSACQSGVGDSWPREGAIGMQRAFRLAGAHEVVASQWSIGDESTREWMRALYAARTGPAIRAADASAAACRRVLAARRSSHRSTHPFYWAAFTATGA